MRAFSSCGERGLVLITMRGLLIVVTSLVAEPRRALGARASIVVAHGLQ